MPAAAIFSRFGSPVTILRAASAVASEGTEPVSSLLVATLPQLVAGSSATLAGVSRPFLVC